MDHHQSTTRKKRKRSVSFADDVIHRDKIQDKNTSPSNDGSYSENPSMNSSRKQSKYGLLERKGTWDKIENFEKKFKAVSVPKIKGSLPDKDNTIKFVYSKAVERALTKFGCDLDERLSKSVEPLDFESSVSKLPEIYEDLVFMERSKNVMELPKMCWKTKGKSPPPLKLPPICNGSTISMADEISLTNS